MAAFREPSASLSAGDQLSPMEQGVLERLARGLLYKEVAEDLRVSVSTVRTHVWHIYRKLQVHNVAEALFGPLGWSPNREVAFAGRPFTVIGVLEKRKGGFMGENEDDNVVLMPYRTGRIVAPRTSDWMLLVIRARSGQPGVQVPRSGSGGHLCRLIASRS